MSGTNKVRVIYWDACVYLAWLMDEQSHGIPYIDAIAHTVRENAEGKNCIITSAIIFIEVLASRIGEEREAKFRKAFRSGRHIARDVDPAIAMEARDIRDKLLKHPSGKNLTTPDAIQLATAKLYRADVVFSFDDGQKDRRHLGLLELNRDPLIGGLEISKPIVLQGTFL